MIELLSFKVYFILEDLNSLTFGFSNVCDRISNIEYILKIFLKIMPMLHTEKCLCF